METKNHAQDFVQGSASTHGAATAERSRDAWYDIPVWLADWVKNLVRRYPEVKGVILDRTYLLRQPNDGYSILVSLGEECYDPEGTQLGGIEQRMTFDPSVQDDRIHLYFIRSNWDVGAWSWSLEEGPPTPTGNEDRDAAILHGKVMGVLHPKYQKMWTLSLVLYDSVLDGLSFDWLMDQPLDPTVAPGWNFRRVMNELASIVDPEDCRAVAARVCEAKLAVDAAVRMIRRWRLGQVRSAQSLELTDAVTGMVEEWLTRHPSMPHDGVWTALRDARNQVHSQEVMAVYGRFHQATLGPNVGLAIIHTLRPGESTSESLGLTAAIMTTVQEWRTRPGAMPCGDPLIALKDVGTLWAEVTPWRL